jgi:hypothetical protein
LSVARWLRGGLIALALAVGAGAPAFAGRPCSEPQPLKPETLQRALGLATKTWQALNASGAKVVLLARAGQDLSSYGLRYSHFGFAYLQTQEQGPAVWRVAHKLNECGTAESAIYRQGLGEFFMDDLWKYEAAWLLPTPAVQQRLLSVLQDEQKLLQMHHKAYSMVAYPWAQTYQQSNQWAIETLAMAMAGDGKSPAVNDRVQAQTWLRQQGYEPSTLTISALKRLGARMTRANVSFDDHPNAKRFSDHIETVTVDSVFAWMPRAGLATQAVVVLREGSAP